MQMEKLRICSEIQLENELFELLEGDVVESILKEAQFEEDVNIWKNLLEGHSFKVTPQMAPALYQLFSEVKSRLNYQKEIEFYVTNDPQLNAFAVPRITDTMPDLINVNSGLIEMLDNDELSFVVGHEIGHLISRNARVSRLIQFIFPGSSTIPLILSHKIDLWKKLSELSADRMGFLACPNLEKCISGFFKLSSGLKTSRINFDYLAYLDNNEEVLKYFTESNNPNLLSHPINPLRVKALQVFSQSETFRRVMAGEEMEDDPQLDSETDKLTEILLTLSNSEMDYHRKYFVATGGLMMSVLDKQLDQEEHNNILGVLSRYTVFPEAFLKNIAESGQVEEIFEASITNILAKNPAERFGMLEYLVDMALSDNQIFRQEIDFVYHIGENKFGLTRREIAQHMARNIQGKFMPKLYG
jgi:hypothetical protein